MDDDNTIWLDFEWGGYLIIYCRALLIVWQALSSARNGKTDWRSGEQSQKAVKREEWNVL